MTYSIEGKGFSLIEMMVTMLIVTIGMLALGSFYIASVNSETMAQERLAAVHLAEQVLEDWQKSGGMPTPDCKIAGANPGALVIGTVKADCVPNDGAPVPFDIVLTVADAKAPIPNGHPSHTTAGGAPEMGDLLTDLANINANVKIRNVKISWEHGGQVKNVSLTHITRKPSGP